MWKHREKSRAKLCISCGSFSTKIPNQVTLEPSLFQAVTRTGNFGMQNSKNKTGKTPESCQKSSEGVQARELRCSRDFSAGICFETLTLTSLESWQIWNLAPSSFPGMAGRRMA